MKVVHEPGFILHTYKYRESSLIVEALTHQFGRISLIAKGARRWKKRGTHTYLKPFQQFGLSWVGRGDMGTLTGAEEIPPLLSLSGDALYCGFYINELLMRLLHRHDPHEQLFNDYTNCLEQLDSGQGLEASLRIFEKRMLLETGYGLNLAADVANGSPVLDGTMYWYTPNQGPAIAAGDKVPLHQLSISGKSLLAYKDEKIDDPDTLRELKHLMRGVIDHQLNYKPLASRKMFGSSVSTSKQARISG